MIPASAIQDWLDLLVKWAADQADIFALVLVGSFARGMATDESDIDIILITNRPQEYIQNTDRAEFFGEIKKHQIEDWGMVTSLRVGYKNGKEIEFGVTAPAWVAQPLDAGSRSVILDGIFVLFDRFGLFKFLNDPPDNVIV